jgi:uncharacterized protein
MARIYIRSSKIDGLGLIIGEDIKKDEIVSRLRGETKFLIIKSLEDTFSNPNWIGIAENQWIDPEKPYKFINHSCNPTVGMKGKKTLVALRNLKEGEEVTIDYSTIEGDPNWKMQCVCNEKTCRKIIRSVEFIPEDQFRKMHPYIPSYFKSLYIRKRKILEVTRK